MDAETEIVATLCDPEAIFTYMRNGIGPQHFFDKKCRDMFLWAVEYYRDFGGLKSAPTREIMADKFPSDFDERVSMAHGAAPSYLCSVVKDEYVRREMSDAFRVGAPMLSQDPVAAANYMREATSLVLDNCVPSSQRIEYGKDLEGYEKDVMTRNDVKGAPYPFPGMQDWTGGIKPGELAILVGPTGFGKSLFACKQALEAVRQGWNVYYASLELDVYDILQRIEFMEVNSNGLKVPVSEYIKGNVRPEYDREMHEARKRIAGMPGKLVVEHPPITDRTPEALISACKMSGCDFIIVDQLQFVTKPKADSMFEATAQCVYKIKSLISSPSDNHPIPMMMLHQMTRQGAKDAQRGGKIGTAQDVAHSSVVEQLADVLWGIGRDAGEEASDTMNIATLKQRRFAPVGWKLDWDPSVSMRFAIAKDFDGNDIRLSEW